MKPKPNRLIAAAALLSVLAGCSSAAPTNPPSATPTVSPVASADQLGLTGVLFFHRYSSYAAWDAQLFGLDLAAGRLTEISAGWKSVVSPINAHPNPAGDALVFMASTTGLAENEWDVFVSHWNGSKWAEPINLTGPNGKRDEDPKFSPNGHTIAYKEDGVLATIEIDGNGKQLLTVGSEESSMPYFTVDGSGLLFERNGSIWLRKADGSSSAIWQKGNTHAYYPIGVDSDRYLFTEVQTNQHDRIDWGYYDGRPTEPLFFSDDTCDNSDSYPYADGKRFIFYVTGCAVSFKGGYNLVVADLASRTSYDLDQINPESNSGLEELGPSWSATAHLN